MRISTRRTFTKEGRKNIQPYNCLAQNPPSLLHYSPAQIMTGTANSVRRTSRVSRLLFGLIILLQYIERLLALTAFGDQSFAIPAFLNFR